MCSIIECVSLVLHTASVQFFGRRSSLVGVYLAYDGTWYIGVNRALVFAQGMYIQSLFTTVIVGKL